MSTITILPVTNVITNGSSVYILKTKSNEAPLKHVEVSSKTSDTINLDMSDMHFESVAFAGGSDLGRTTLEWIRQSIDSQNFISVSPTRPITCDATLKEEYIVELRRLVELNYSIELPEVYITSISISGNTTITGPGEYIFEAIYEPESASVDLGWSLRTPSGSGITYEQVGSGWNKIKVIVPESYSGTDTCDLTITDYNSGLDASVELSLSISKPVTSILLHGPASITAPGTYKVWCDIYPADAEYNLYYSTAIVFGASITLQEDPEHAGDDRYRELVVETDSSVSHSGFYVEFEDANTGVSDRLVIPIDITIDIPTHVYDLYNEWMVSEYDKPADASEYLMFQSGSNWHVPSSTSSMYVRFEGSNSARDINIFINSRAESVYDYTIAYELDSESTEKATTSGKQYDPSETISNYTIVTYTIPGDGNEHFVKITYKKDGSADNSYDRGFVLVPSGYEYKNAYEAEPEPEVIYINTMTITGTRTITEAGTYEYVAVYAPSDANTYNIVWSTSSIDGVTIAQSETDPFIAYVTVSEGASGRMQVFAKDTVMGVNYGSSVISVDVPAAPVVEGEIYYSNSSEQYVLDKSTSTWTEKTWSGITDFDGRYMWTDGTNIYYSNSTISIGQRVLDKSTSTWIEKTWSGFTPSGNQIWTDGDNIYYSYYSEQYVLDKSTSTWTEKTWSGLTSFSGNYVWTDGTNIYYSEYYTHFILDKSTSTWTEKTWSGITDFDGHNIWSDGTNIYYSTFIDWSSSRPNGTYKLDGNTWTEISWNGVSRSFRGYNTWTDGDNIYYDYDGEHYILSSTETWASNDWNNDFIEGDNNWSSNPQFKVHKTLHCSTFGAFNN